MKRTILALALLLATTFTSFSQTHTLPGNNVVPSTGSFTIQSGAPLLGTWNFGGATVLGISASSIPWSGVTGTPTTLAGYGITDAQPLDSDLTSIAALSTTAFGRGSLTQTDAAAFRTYIGAGISSFSGAFSSLSGIPTTFGGYGITDSSANLRAALTDENGTGAALFSAATDASLTTPKITTGIKDANGNTIVGFTPTASAVNYLDVNNATSAGHEVVLDAAGTSTDISLRLIPKGAGTVRLHTSLCDISVNSGDIVMDVGGGLTVGQGSTDTPMTLIGAGTGTGNKAIFSLANIAGSTTRTVNIAGTANSTTVVSDTGASNNFLTAVSADGAISKAQPAFSNLSGNWTLAQGPNTTASTLLGRTSASAGIPQEITLGTNLSMSGTTLNATGGGGSPGGSDKQLQYNNAGAFGGASTITIDANGNLVLTGAGTPPYYSQLRVDGGGDSAVFLRGGHGTPNDWFFGAGTGGGSPNNFFRIVDLTTSVTDVLDIQTGSGHAIGIFGELGWGASGAGGTLDTGITRNAAGVVEFNNGTTGTYRDMIARNLTLNGAITVVGGGSFTDDVTVSRSYATTTGLLSFGVGTNVYLYYDATKLRLNNTNFEAPTVNASTGYQKGGAEFPTASNGLVKRTAANTYSPATADTDYASAVSTQDVGDANATITAGVNVVRLTTALTAARVLTLPAASGYNAQKSISIINPKGVTTSVNTIAVARAGTDTIDGGTANVTVINAPFGYTTLWSDGTGKWSTSNHIDTSNIDTGTLSAARMPAHTGDVTTSAGSIVTTLAAGNAGNLNSGTLLAARMPALTGDVTTSAGAVATTLANIPSAVTMAGSLLATAIAAPGTPAAGKGSIYVDSTSKNLAVKDDAGIVKHGVQTRTASANNWIRAIDDAGATTISQPAFTDVSGSVAASQEPAHTGDVTTSAGSIVTTLANVPNTATFAAPDLTTAPNNLGGWTEYKCTADRTTTGQTLVDVTDLVSGTLSNSAKYEIEAVLDVLTSAVTTGVQYGVQTGGTGGAGIVSVILTGNTTGTTASSEGLSTTPATASTARLLTSAQSGTMLLKGLVTTRSTGTATISIQHLKVTSGTSTVKIGSTLRIRKK